MRVTHRRCSRSNGGAPSGRPPGGRSLRRRGPADADHPPAMLPRGVVRVVHKFLICRGESGGKGTSYPTGTASSAGIGSVRSCFQGLHERSWVRGRPASPPSRCRALLGTRASRPHCVPANRQGLFTLTDSRPGIDWPTALPWNGASHGYCRDCLHSAPIRHPARMHPACRCGQSPIAQRERRQRPCLPGLQARIVERAAQDEPRHGFDVRHHRLPPEPHRFQRNRPAARERVQHPRRPPPRTPPGSPPETSQAPRHPRALSGRSRPGSSPSSAPHWRSTLPPPAPPSAPAVCAARPGGPDPAAASPATPPGSPPTASTPARCATSKCTRAARSFRGRSRGRFTSAGTRLRSGECCLFTRSARLGICQERDSSCNDKYKKIYVT